MNRCPACKKFLYRTDDCKGGGIPCGRTDNGRKPSGGSSAVERRPSKSTVEGSTPSPRSKDSAPAADAQLEGGKSSGKKGRKASNARVTAGTRNTSAAPDGGSSNKPKTRAKKKAHGGAGGYSVGALVESPDALDSGFESHPMRSSAGEAESPSPLPAPVDLTTRGTPRIRAPKGTYDRKAYQALKARRRRERDRAAKAAKEQK